MDGGQEPLSKRGGLSPEKRERVPYKKRYYDEGQSYFIHGRRKENHRLRDGSFKEGGKIH